MEAQYVGVNLFPSDGAAGGDAEVGLFIFSEVGEVGTAVAGVVKYFKTGHCFGAGFGGGSEADGFLVGRYGDAGGEVQVIRVVQCAGCVAADGNGCVLFNSLAKVAQLQVDRCNAFIIVEI